MFASTKTSRIELFRYALTLPILIALSACGTDVALEHTKPTTQTTTSSVSMPKELRAAYIASMQHDANADYVVHASGNFARMSNPAQRFVATIDPSGLSLTPDRNTEHVSLHAQAIGCEGAMVQLAEARLEATANRVSLWRDGLEEWYLHGPLGVEQGFVIPVAPACAGFKRISMAVDSDWRATLEDTDGNGQSDAVFFLDAQGSRHVGYTDLFVVDATGKTIPAWLSLLDDRITIVVDDMHATYPLSIDPLVWVQQAQLLANDGAASDYFGISASISGDTALVGASRDNVGATTDQGSAYIFVRNGLTWTQQAQLVAADGAASDFFGISVSLSGDTAVVGAWADDVGVNQDQGSAYVFVRNATVWTQQAQLVAVDGSMGDLFGYSVSISGNTLLVGARYDDYGAKTNQGSAYVFVRNGATWTQQVQLVPNDGSASDEFGWSVSLSGDTALVGAYHDDVGVNGDQGSAYVFVRNGAIWTQQAQLLANDGAASDLFGHSLSISGDTAVVGAHFHDVGANTDQGAAYVFVRNGTTWMQQAQLLANDGGTSDAFGMSVAVSGDTAVVGAWYDDVGANMNQGSAYVFLRNGTTWTQQAQLTASDGAASDLFGSSVSISGDTALVGAEFDTVAGNTWRGSASVFIVVAPKSNGEDCAVADECQSGFCVDGVCCNTACGSSLANDCQVCSTAAGAAVNGTCAVATAGTVCRGAAGACDIAEMCDGVASDCPTDNKLNAGQVCRISKGLCDEFEFCDGMAADCPPDTKTAAGVPCRSAKGLCDEPEACDGASDTCPTDKLTPMGTVCRPANGACDVSEACTGASAQCPTDAFVAAGVQCRASQGQCDIEETCDGAMSDCPSDTKVAAGTECRGSAGACDRTETCDGATNDCPVDTKALAGTDCRTSTGACDIAETCDGTANDCPIDAKSPNGSACKEGTCNDGVCVGDGGSGGMGAGGAGNAGMGGTGGDVSNGGSAGTGNEPTDPGGCSCRVVSSSSRPSAAWSLFGLAVLAWRRRRSKQETSGSAFRCAYRPFD